MSVKKKTKRNTELPIGSDLSFSGKEAYKLLRTNLLFSLPQEGTGARRIGITSSVSGEGKSMTAINLAYTLAEVGMKILLIECDMRKPTIGKRLGIPSSPGLSNILVRLPLATDTLHRDVLLKGMDVILAGDIPPNPAELLGSGVMQIVLNKMGEHYDYIILDLPPVTSVSDALVVCKWIDGVILVTRQEYTTKAVLANTVRQLKYVNAHILGFVFNDASTSGGKYKQYRDYKNYTYEE